MYQEIESKTEPKKILIIDDNVDFCKLMTFYLSKSDCKVYSSFTLKDALESIEKEKPGLIVADKKLHRKFQQYLNELIDSMQHYYPKMLIVDATKKEPDDAFIYTIKRDNTKPSGFLEKIIKYIEDLFK